MREIADKIFEKEFTVEEKDIAANIKSGAMRVLATPVLVAWMEGTACDFLESYLEGDESTVGTEVSIRHTAPTPVGSVVTVRLELKEVNGREYAFYITARDEVGEIADCDHRRFVIYKEKFQKKADARTAGI